METEAENQEIEEIWERFRKQREASGERRWSSSASGVTYKLTSMNPNWLYCANETEREMCGSQLAEGSSPDIHREVLLDASVFAHSPMRINKPMYSSRDEIQK